MYLLDKRWFAVSALVIVTLAGGYLRMDSLSHWLDNKDRYFFDDQQIPLMLSVDGYFYLDAAKAVQEGTYETFDDRRLVPDGYHRSPTPPLLAVITAFLGKFFNVSLEWVAIILSPVLGMLLAIPCYLLGSGLVKRARGTIFIPPERLTSASRLAGLVAALFALISPFLVERNSVGWFDTDMLNVSFAVLFSWLALELAVTENKIRAFSCLLGYGCFFLVFLWWWDQSVVPVVGLAGVPLLVAMVILGRRSPKQLMLVLLFIVGLALAFGFWKGFSVLNPVRYWYQLTGMFGYISSDVKSSVFRAAGAAVSEQAVAPLALLVVNSCGGWISFVASFVGLIALIWLSRGCFLFLTAIILVAVLSFRGQRFLIFWAPLFGLGIGTLVFIAYGYLSKSGWRVAVLVACVVSFAWAPLQQVNNNKGKTPRRSPVLFDAMKVIGENAEKNAVIWASWGHGHPLVYYTQKGVIGDGIFHTADIQYVLNFPLTTSDYRLAANWISFYVAHGRKGLREANTLFGGSDDAWSEGIPVLQQMLAYGIEGAQLCLEDEYGFSGQLLEKTLLFLFPGSVRPVYLFLDYLLLRQDWFVLGRWDVVTKSGPTGHSYTQVYGLRNDNTGRIKGRIGSAMVAVDALNGRVLRGKHSVMLKEIRFYEGGTLRIKVYPNNSGELVLNMMFPLGVGVLGDTVTVNTLLNKLFFELRTDERFFKPVAMELPYYSIWQVEGERYVH